MQFWNITYKKKILTLPHLKMHFLSMITHAKNVLFLSHLLLFEEYFIWLNSFLWSPNTNSGFLLWFVTLCQGLTVSMFQIHLVSRCDGRSQQLFFFWGGERMKGGSDRVLWRSCHLCLPTEPKEIDGRLGMVLEVPDLQCTWPVCFLPACFNF